MKNIPAKFFTGDTMYRLASEVGHVEEIAYDPKVSHTKDYIRALITFDTEKPAKSYRKLTVSKDVTVTIEFEYERIHKKCFHCYRLTHEKFCCPSLRKGPSAKLPNNPSSSNGERTPTENSPIVAKEAPLDGPPGFPAMFPELPPQERSAALLYISHSDETERQARIIRVRQAIEEQGQSHVATLTRFTTNLDKGKGHVFSYPDLEVNSSPPLLLQQSASKEIGDQNELSASSCSGVAENSTPTISTGFQIGVSSKHQSAGDSSGAKAPRRRPPSWKRKAQAGKASVQVSPPSELAPPTVGVWW